MPVAGVRLATANAGIRYRNRDDLLLIHFSDGATCAGVFTRNAFCAAPIVIARQHLQQHPVRAFLINAGNANAGTGEAGMQAARQTCIAAANAVGCASEQVLPFSTGVIGQVLPVTGIEDVLPAMAEQLNEGHWNQAAKAIMTTDTVAKGVSRSVAIGGKTVTLTGIAKGSGMIRPDMATMLAFLATDAGVEQSVLQRCLGEAVDTSFNRITVDGDTSTNDACMLVATGQSGVDLGASGENLNAFMQALKEVCILLAQAVIRDGEGATKFITVDVEQGVTEQECLDVAYTIAHSPLIKTAFFASDANWGRILAAIGRAGLEGLDINKVSVFLNDVCIVDQGGLASAYTEQQGQAVMSQEEITIHVMLGRGQAHERIWTTDLSHDYVTINAEYRT
jgi:glutamate N-acetyltransferase/amino-acid N-acetyltransferase